LTIFFIYRLTFIIYHFVFVSSSFFACGYAGHALLMPSASVPSAFVPFSFIIFIQYPASSIQYLFSICRLLENHSTTQQLNHL